MPTNKEKKKSGDSSGRDRLASNVLFSWFGYLFIVVSGFILPRVIDSHIGQVSLGIWDLSWSLVSYLNFAMLGIGSSVNRYVAMYRSQNEPDKIRGAVSSVFCLQIVIALLALLCTLILAWLLPLFLQDQQADLIDVSRWVVILLGASLAVQFAGDTSKGVITGCHRWDILNIVMTISHVTMLVLMIFALYHGHGLKAMSVIYFVVVVVTEVVRMAIAYRICPELSIKWRYVSRSQLKEMFVFGGKTFMAQFPQIVLTQTTNVMVATTLGPAALAVFARPMALVRHFESFMTRFSFVLTPMAGSMMGNDKRGEVRQLLLDTASYGVAFALPMVLTLSIYGDLLLGIWMGPRYANGVILGILAIGYFLPVSQNSVLRVLVGMNLHGRIALISMVVMFALYGVGFMVVTNLGWGLKSGALLVAIPLAIGNGVAIPIYACRTLDIPLTEYLRKVFILPLLCGLPFVACLLIGRIIFPESPLYALFSGGGGGSLLIILLYWRFLIPPHYRAKIINNVKNKFGWNAT